MGRLFCGCENQIPPCPPSQRGGRFAIFLLRGNHDGSSHIVPTLQRGNAKPRTLRRLLRDAGASLTCVPTEDRRNDLKCVTHVPGLYTLRKGGNVMPGSLLRDGTIHASNVFSEEPSPRGGRWERFNCAPRLKTEVRRFGLAFEPGSVKLATHSAGCCQSALSM